MINLLGANPTAVAVLDAVSLLEQINTSLGTWYTAIDLVSAFFSTLVYKVPQGVVCFQLTRPENTPPSLSHLMGVSVLQPYVII